MNLLYLISNLYFIFSLEVPVHCAIVLKARPLQAVLLLVALISIKTIKHKMIFIQLRHKLAIFHSILNISLW